ncbi:MAG: adenylate/guanylate cyclase domain-containing protein [Leptospiraceae bacterium]|nr:adenylate/guanylate cyclase domain-containing protein [Leptospiraceae bacterium]
MKKFIVPIFLILTLFLCGYFYLKAFPSDFQEKENLYFQVLDIYFKGKNLQSEFLKLNLEGSKKFESLDTSLSSYGKAIGEFPPNRTSDSGQILNAFQKDLEEKTQLLKYYKVYSIELSDARFNFPKNLEHIEKEKFIKNSQLREFLVAFHSAERGDTKRFQSALERLKKLAVENEEQEFSDFLAQTELLINHPIEIRKFIEKFSDQERSKEIEIFLDSLHSEIKKLSGEKEKFQILFFTTLIVLFGTFLLASSYLAHSKSLVLQENQAIKTRMEFYEQFVPKESLSLISSKPIERIYLGESIKREMTVLYSDIRSFNSLSSTMTTVENFEFLNSYLKHMGPIVRKYSGFIDKYVGDAILALFEGETDNAVRAAIEMQMYLKKYFEKYEGVNYREPIEIGIGLHSGEMMIGTLGENNRMENSLISDSIKLVPRIENLTKLYGVKTLITETVLDSLEKPEDFKLRHIDRVRMLSKTRPLHIYEVYDSDPPELIKLKDLTSDMLKESIRLFYSRDPRSALEILEECIRIIPSDKTFRFHLERCKLWIPRLNEPEEEWEDATEPDFR